MQIRINFIIFFIIVGKKFPKPQLLKDFYSPSSEAATLAVSWWAAPLPVWLLLPPAASSALLLGLWWNEALSSAQLRSLKCHENWLNRWFPLPLASCRITSPALPPSYLPCSIFTPKSNSLSHCLAKCPAAYCLPFLLLVLAFCLHSHK